MSLKNLYIINFFLIIAFASVFLNFDSQNTSAQTYNVTATIQISVCGNDVLEGGEDCDGSDFGGNSCRNLGYAEGSLTCDISCSLDSTDCSGTLNTGGSGGGGNPFFVPPPPVVVPTGKITFIGKAYPNISVTLLKDGQKIKTVVSDSNANFIIDANGLSNGNYIFSLYAEDKYGMKSILENFSNLITQGSESTISGIIIPPTLDMDKVEVKKGETIKFFGQAAPLSDISIRITPNLVTMKTLTDVNGLYSYNFDTTSLPFGEYNVVVLVKYGARESNLSKSLKFKIGEETILKEEEKNKEEKLIMEEKSDINNDSKVNLVDFSIAAFWYQRSNPPASVDLNNDGKVSLVDFSIMAFYWTG